MLDGSFWKSYLISVGFVILDSQNHTGVFLLSNELESLLLWSSQGVLEVVNGISSVGINDRWESGHSLLPLVEAGEGVIHLSVDDVLDSSSLLHKEDWLVGSVHGVVVETLKLEDSQVVLSLVANVGVTGLEKLAVSSNMLGEPFVVSNNGE